MLSGRPYRITPRTAGGRPVRVTGWAGPWPVQDKWRDGVPVRQYLQVTGVQVTGAEGGLTLVGDRQGGRDEGVDEEDGEGVCGERGGHSRMRGAMWTTEPQRCFLEVHPVRA